MLHVIHHGTKSHLQISVFSYPREFNVQPSMSPVVTNSSKQAWLASYSALEAPVHRFSKRLSIWFSTRFILFLIVSVFMPPSHVKNVSLKIRKKSELFSSKPRFWELLVTIIYGLWNYQQGQQFKPKNLSGLLDKGFCRRIQAGALTRLIQKVLVSKFRKYFGLKIDVFQTL